MIFLESSNYSLVWRFRILNICDATDTEFVGFQVKVFFGSVADSWSVNTVEFFGLLSIYECLNTLCDGGDLRLLFSQSGILYPAPVWSSTGIFKVVFSNTYSAQSGFRLVWQVRTF